MYRSQPCRSCILIGILWIVFSPMSAAGQLLVADRIKDQILEYNLDGTSTGFSVSTPSTPSAMAFGSGSDLFVASEATGTVYRYNWLTPNNPDPINTGLNGIGGLLYDNASNTLYVSEYNGFTGRRIVKYNATTGAQIGVLDVGDAAQDLADMALGTDGSLYVSSYWDGKVYKGNSNTGNFSALSGISGMLQGASGIVLDSSDKLNIKLDVIGMWTNNVIQCKSDGNSGHELVPMSGGGLDWPSDIVIDPDGNLLISSIGYDTPNGYIGKYDSTTGTEIEPSPFITFSESTQPTALLIEPAVWTGGAAEIDSWTNAANWRGTPPVYPLPIIFGVATGGHVTNFNDYASLTQFNGITFATGAPQYTLQGNAIKLGGPVVNQSANDQEIDLDMQLVPGGGSFDTGDQKKLTIGGLISGDGSLIKKGSGTLTITGGLTYTGLTDIQAGTLQINTGISTALANITGAGALVIDNTTTLSANSVAVGTVTIGAGSTLVINALPGGPEAFTELKAVPEPGNMALLATAALAQIAFLSRRRKT
jgi:autotransporter-associated beta strand protein